MMYISGSGERWHKSEGPWHKLKPDVTKLIQRLCTMLWFSMFFVLLRWYCFNIQHSVVLLSCLWICTLIHACPSVNSLAPLSCALSLYASLGSLVKTYEINFRPQRIAMTSPTGNLCVCIVDFRSRVRDMYLTRCLPDRCLHPSGCAGTEGRKARSSRVSKPEDVLQWFHLCHS